MWFYTITPWDIVIRRTWRRDGLPVRTDFETDFRTERAAHRALVAREERALGYAKLALPYHTDNLAALMG